MAEGTIIQRGSSVPPGAFVFFAMNTAPTGWLKANGAAISRTTFSALFDAIGTTFGAGDGSTTFNLPDMRGEFPRGWDDGRGVDSWRSFGTAQGDELKSHRHDVNAELPDNGGPNGRPMWAGRRLNNTTNLFGRTQFTGGDETRPRNIALLACIKF